MAVPTAGKPVNMHLHPWGGGSSWLSQVENPPKRSTALNMITQRPSRAVPVYTQTARGLERNGKPVRSYDVPVPTRDSHPRHVAATPRHVSKTEESRVGSTTKATPRRKTTIHHAATKRRKATVIHTHHGPEAGNGPYYGNVLASGSSGIDVAPTLTPSASSSSSTSSSTSSQSDANASAIAALQSQLQSDEGTLSALQSTIDAINQEASAPTTATSSSASSFFSSTTGKVVLVAGVALGAWWYIRHRKSSPKKEEAKT